MSSRSGTDSHSTQITLPIEIALDLLASHLNQVSGPACIFSPNPALIAAAKRRIGESIDYTVGIDGATGAGCASNAQA